MAFVEGADDRPERISIARCRELLGEEADSMTDADIVLVRRHAETMAAIDAVPIEEVGQPLLLAS